MVAAGLSAVAAVTQVPFLGGASILAFVGLLCHGLIGSCSEAARTPQRLHLYHLY